LKVSRFFPRWRDTNLVGAEGDEDHLVLGAFMILPEIVKFCCGFWHLIFLVESVHGFTQNLKGYFPVFVPPARLRRQGWRRQRQWCWVQQWGRFPLLQFW